MLLSQTQRLFSLLSGLWVGSFITIGFLVVPVLFTSLGDREVASMVAANLFKTTAYIGVGFSVLLIAIAHYLVIKEQRHYLFLRWLLLGMLFCTISTAFLIIPWMNSLREQALLAGLSVRESSNAIFLAVSTVYPAACLLPNLFLACYLSGEQQKKRRLAAS